MKIEVEFPDEYGPGTGTIGPDEHHPAADMAMEWYRDWLVSHPLSIHIALESFASTALSGNRMAEICQGTLKRLIAGEPVSDRYLLGLCWMLREMQDMTTYEV